jgi:hypothetical protein
MENSPLPTLKILFFDYQNQMAIMCTQETIAKRLDKHITLSLNGLSREIETAVGGMYA